MKCSKPRRAFKFRPNPATVLRRARRRYHRLPVTQRPAPQPENFAGLFRPSELDVLWASRRWPLSPDDLRFVLTRPRVRRRRRVVVRVRVAVEGY
jgi:hypothetical protein